MKPIQYQKGYVEFYKLKFKVTPDVLIPRPETELLVDEVIKFTNTSSSTALTILDIGTGSGNIAISLAKNLSHLRGVTISAIDISPKALKVAQQNAKLHGTENRIRFIKSNLLNAFCHPEPFASLEGKLREESSHTMEDSLPASLHGRSRLVTRDDNLIVVTNLPYIPSARIPYLDSSVKDFEPLIALDGGPDGFHLYRKLFMQIKEKGWKPKLIIGEIDYTHGELASNEAKKYFPDYLVEIKTDLAYKQRILLITPCSVSV